MIRTEFWGLCTICLCMTCYTLLTLKKPEERLYHKFGTDRGYVMVDSFSAEMSISARSTKKRTPILGMSHGSVRSGPLQQEHPTVTTLLQHNRSLAE